MSDEDQKKDIQEDVQKDVEKDVEKDAEKDVQKEDKPEKEQMNVEEGEKKNLTFIERYKKALSRGFYHLGKFVGKYYLYAMLTSIVVSGLFGIGLMKAQRVDDPGKIWVAQNSLFALEERYYASKFGSFYGQISFMMILKNGDNIIQQKYLEQLYDLEVGMQNVQATYNGQTINFGDVCARAWVGSECITNTPLWYWGFDYNIINSTSQTGLLNAVNNPAAQGPVRNLLTVDQLIGGVTRDANGRVVSATAFLTTYLLWGDENLKDKVKAYEGAYLSYIKARVANFPDPDIEIAFFADRSIQDVLADTITADFQYIVISYVVMFVYVSIALGKLDLIESRILVGISAIISIVFSIVLSLGLCSAAGVNFSPVSLQVIPFLLLGIGTNDIFVLTDAFSRNKPITDLTERLAVTFEQVGTSTLLTSATNCVAFFVASASTMPAVKWFSIQAGVGVITNWLVLVFLFSPILIIDARRVQQNRMDVLFCIKLNRGKPSPKGERIKNLVQDFITKVYVPFIAHPIVNLIIIVFFIGCIGVSIYGAMKIERGLGVNDVVPSDSYPAIYLNGLTKYFPGAGPPVYLVLRDIDYSDHAIQDLMDETITNVESSRWVSGSFVSWWRDFKTWTTSFGNLPAYNLNTSSYLVNGRIPPDKFYPWLNFFIKQDVFVGTKYHYDIVFKDDGTVDASRMLIQSQGLANNSAYIEATVDVRAATAKTNINGFPYSVYYVFFEQYLVIARESITLILSSLATVVVITFLITGHVGVTFISSMTIVFILVTVMSIMTAWDIDLNAISLANLVACVGFAVGFSAYITKSYVESKGTTSVDKMRDSMIEMGAAVFNGGISTFLSVVALAGASYQLFAVYYFRMWFNMVIVGIAYGLIFLPAALAHSFVLLFKRK